MSGSPVTDKLMREARPVLVKGLQRQRNTDGEMILVNANLTSYLTVSDDEAGALDLIDGKRTLRDVVTDAITLSTPIRPMATLSLVRRLHGADLVTGLENAGDLFPANKNGLGAKLAKLLGALLQISIPLPLLGTALTAGKMIPRSVWPAASKAGIALFVLAAGVTSPRGVHAAVGEVPINTGGDGHSRLLVIFFWFSFLETPFSYSSIPVVLGKFCQ